MDIVFGFSEVIPSPFIRLSSVPQGSVLKPLLFSTVVFNLGYAYNRGYAKISQGVRKIKNIYLLFHDKHWIIRDRIRVSHRRPGHKDIRFGSAIFLSLSLLYAIIIWAASIILFHTVRWNVTEFLLSFFSFKTYYLVHYFECNLFNLF
jgi:hypothetical protein